MICLQNVIVSIRFTLSRRGKMTTLLTLKSSAREASCDCACLGVIEDNNSTRRLRRTAKSSLSILMWNTPKGVAYNLELETDEQPSVY